MQSATDAINTLQSVPFTINVPVLDFLLNSSGPPAPSPRLHGGSVRASVEPQKGAQGGIYGGAYEGVAAKWTSLQPLS